MIKLAELLKNSGIIATPKYKDLMIREVCSDSRHAARDTVFVCIRGAVHDGHRFAASAYSRGCRVFIVEGDISLPGLDTVDIIRVNDSRAALADLSAAFYGQPSREIKIIGITGTKGKTTVALMVQSVLNKNGLPTGYIGSNGISYGVFHHSSVNTTPESCDIQRYLRDMVNAGMKYAVIEVSSQGLYLDRVRGLVFDTCVFTNLSPDHIGGHEHPSFEHYRDCKAKLFSGYEMKRAIFNADDDHSSYMQKNCTTDNIVTYGIRNEAMHSAIDIDEFRTNNSFGMSFSYMYKSSRIPVRIRFPGEFSVSNTLAAIAVCHGYIDDISRIVSFLPDITVAGRFEPVDALPYATVIIDYAHNGLSMRSVLTTLRHFTTGRLITLFGSVGDRTEMRRAELGSAASELSDFIIITSDNPGFENPMNIIADIERAVSPDCPYEKIIDRREAIFFAMRQLREGDVLLLAGKGHEDYQFIGDTKLPFCERKIVLEAAQSILASQVYAE